MIDKLSKMLASLLREKADKIESGNCVIYSAEALHIVSVFSHEPLSKAQACKFLNVGRSKFGYLMAEGKIPKGGKEKGFKELVWYKDELMQCL